LLGIPATQTSI